MNAKIVNLLVNSEIIVAKNEKKLVAAYIQATEEFFKVKKSDKANLLLTITNKYNKIASENGLDAISSRTIENRFIAIRAAKNKGLAVENFVSWNSLTVANTKIGKGLAVVDNGILVDKKVSSDNSQEVAETGSDIAKKVDAETIAKDKKVVAFLAYCIESGFDLSEVAKIIRKGAK